MSTNFLQGRRGISEIVVTLVLVLLSLVAIGIVWVVVSGIVNTGTEQVNQGAKCLELNIEATALTSNAAGTSYNLTLTRSAGGEAIGGVKVVLSNNASSSSPIDFGIALALLDTKKQTLTLSPALLNATSVKVTPYFKDASGNEQLCSNTKTFTF